MIEVSVVRSPPRPVGDWPEGINSANMFEVRIGSEYVFASVDEGEALQLKDRLVAALSKVQQALQLIARLWPDPGMCAEVVPEFVGQNDGRLRADLLWAALNAARAALNMPTYPPPDHWKKREEIKC
jgi:hypothetical protein